MSARRRTVRDERRRRLGQNFLRPQVAEEFVEAAGISAGELVVEIGPGAGAITLALARRDADVVAVELDEVWAERLRQAARDVKTGRIRVVTADFLGFRLPNRPFRVVSCLPFGFTTEILRRLLDHPASELVRADLIVQWEVARKRAEQPPNTLLSTAWAPWWEFELGHAGRPIPARAFRPVPRIDAGVLIVRRRAPAILPPYMAAEYQGFVRERWPWQ